MVLTDRLWLKIIVDINEYRALAGVKLKEEKEREQKRREELMQLQSITKEDEQPKEEAAGREFRFRSNLNFLNPFSVGRKVSTFFPYIP